MVGNPLTSYTFKFGNSLGLGVICAICSVLIGIGVVCNMLVYLAPITNGTILDEQIGYLLFSYVAVAPWSAAGFSIFASLGVVFARNKNLKLVCANLWVASLVLYLACILIAGLLYMKDLKDMRDFIFLPGTLAYNKLQKHSKMARDNKAAIDGAIKAGKKSLAFNVIKFLSFPLNMLVLFALEDIVPIFALIVVPMVGTALIIYLALGVRNTISAEIKESLVKHADLKEVEAAQSDSDDETESRASTQRAPSRAYPAPNYHTPITGVPIVSTGIPVNVMSAQPASMHSAPMMNSLPVGNSQHATQSWSPASYSPVNAAAYAPPASITRSAAPFGSDRAPGINAPSAIARPDMDTDAQAPISRPAPYAPRMSGLPK